MSCCIVVALIIAQILGYRDRIRRLLGMKVDDDAGHEPLLRPGLWRQMRKAIVPAIASIAAGSMAYQHRGHLAELVELAAPAASSAIETAICRNPAAGKNLKPKEIP
ncbi:MAG: hypothetical protein V4724_07830 [Pseudomonadota bacterium]